MLPVICSSLLCQTRLQTLYLEAVKYVANLVWNGEIIIFTSLD